MYGFANTGRDYVTNSYNLEKCYKKDTRRIYYDRGLREDGL